MMVTFTICAWELGALNSAVGSSKL